MDDRTSQAEEVGRTLSDTASVAVEVTWIDGHEWTISWSDGPGEQQMRDSVVRALADPRYAELRGRHFTFLRNEAGGGSRLR